MSKLVRSIAATLALITSISTLSGCAQKYADDDPRSYPLEPALTKSEVLAYYAKSLEFDTLVNRNIDIAKTNYVTKEVTDEATKKMLEEAVENTEDLLKLMEYEYSDENKAILDEENYHYIKSYLDDRKLYDGEISNMTYALGYYFVDVDYKIGAGPVGTFKPTASLVGLNGVIVHSEFYNTDSIDQLFLKLAIDSLNKYFKENKILNKRASFNYKTAIFSTDPAVADEADKTFGTNDFNYTSDKYVDPTLPQPKKDENGEYVYDAFGNLIYEDPIITNLTTGAEGSREQYIDVELFNRVAGSSTRNSAYMPKLDFVFNVPEPEKNGTNDYYISGYGIYPVGNEGLKRFNFDRSNLKGTLTLRYVYKHDINNYNQLINTNIYPVFSEITTGYTSNTDKADDRQIPAFLEVEFEKLIERADRALVNNDITALSSGKIFSDLGVAILNGYQNNHVNVLRRFSKIDFSNGVIARQTGANSYMIKVETQVQEGPKGADVYGTYRDVSYVVIEQRNQEFVITDWLVLNRKMQIEPDINPDSAITKRLVALGLAGEVTEPMKEAANNLIRSLYIASTAKAGRINAKTEAEIPVINYLGEQVQVRKGIQNCFNTNVEMLSSAAKENITSTLTEMLLQHGSNVPVQHYGNVVAWLGGASNQVEFITEEVITYTGRSDGMYLRCYYLISNMEDTWVIDDIKIMEKEEMSGAEFNDIVTRITEQ